MEKVLAIRNVKDGKVYLYGEGEYVGDKKPENFPMKNPCIKLDKGYIVWGFQCWWGSKKEVLQKFPPSEYEYIDVDLKESEKVNESTRA